MSIKTKMLVYILLISSVIYILAVGYISYKLKTNALNDAKDKIDAIAKEYANSVKADLNVDMIMSRGIAQALETYYGQPLAQWKEQQNEILKNIIQKNPQFLSVWTNWELNYVWPNYQKDHGRIRLTYYRINNVIKYKEEVIDTVPGFTKGAYYDVKEKKEELVMDPYYFSYSGIAAEEILETSVGVPIMHNNEFIGLAGIDLSL
jgi:methyl-accepting chemotaxis protein